MIAFPQQHRGTGIIYHADLKPLKVARAPRGGIVCPGCGRDVPANGVIVWSVPWAVAGYCCCVECILWVIRDGYAEFAESLVI